MSDAIKERFSLIFSLIIQNKKPVEVANHYGVTENAIRNWAVGRGPIKSRKKIILEEHSINLDIDNLPEEEWENLLDNLSRSEFSFKGKKSAQSWYFDGEEIHEMEQNIDIHQDIYFITNDCYNICYLPSVYDVMKRNIERGITYTYITNSKIEKLELMKEKLTELNNSCSDRKCGKVRLFIMPISDSDKEWIIIEHFMLFVNQNKDLDIENFNKSEIDYRVISTAYGQVYNIGNQNLERTAWIQLSMERREKIASLVKLWAENIDGCWQNEIV